MIKSDAEVTNEGVVKAIEHLATLRSEIEPIIPELKEQKNKAAAVLSKYEKELSDAETAVREAALDYIQRTGDLEPHPALTFRRTTKLMYDKQEIVKTLVTETLPLELELYNYINDDNASLEIYSAIEDFLGETKLGEYLNVTVTLDVRAFEKAFKEGKLKWAQVEEISAPTIAIGKIGDIIIKKELENGASSK